MPVQRRTDIDWLRGLAIIVMIEAHVFDAWTRADLRGSYLFGRAMILGGFAAPAFLFLAGVAAVLATSTSRVGAGKETAGARSVRRRGWQILGLAFLFRAQAVSLSPGAYLSSLLEVDILNIMGPAIVLCGTVLGAVGRPTKRVALFALLAAACTFLAPIVFASPWVLWLPEPLRSYLRPHPGGSSFALFPWAGFLFAGCAVGVLIDRERGVSADRTFHVALAAAGAVVACAGYAASYLPSIYAQSAFWTTSPTFFFLRIGILTIAMGLARLCWLARRPAPVGRVGAMVRFGRSSLFVYWIHVDIVYGWLTRGLHGALSLPQVTVGFVTVTASMFGLVLLKHLVVERWRARRKRRPVAVVNP